MINYAASLKFKPQVGALGALRGIRWAELFNDTAEDMACGESTIHALEEGCGKKYI
jgi:hypothetical protein